MNGTQLTLTSQGQNYSENANGTSAARPPPHFQTAAVFIILVVIVIIVVTIVGNVLVVVAVFTSRALRAPQNLFLVSLASADILVATLVIPFSLANEIMGYWYFGSTWCALYLALDVLFCTSSIVHLCAISLDRYWSVTKAEPNGGRQLLRQTDLSPFLGFQSGITTLSGTNYETTTVNFQV
ncbi:hypothetical protein ANANG_G00159760 [Anguilla anguilla]|uniref:G-protein coupled receptors family 1 profile domain-containing protein n=1 Tax=Anguilla anguilla TaxID=7936 RepID=A0A9D3M833_ANGAN|nr:hypothetical protein ANANG_G00159760 [Anguilla anguilla]